MAQPVGDGGRGPCVASAGFGRHRNACGTRVPNLMRRERGAMKCVLVLWHTPRRWGGGARGVPVSIPGLQRDGPAEHHVVVLVGEVVAVGHVVAGERPEPAPDLALLARLEGDQVFLAERVLRVLRRAGDADAGAT